MNPFTSTSGRAQGRQPMLVEAATRIRSLPAWITAHRRILDDALLEHGGLLFRGFEVDDVADFQACVDALGGGGLDYTYRSTPRTRVANGVFTATEYPARLEIPLHNENAYQAEWPLHIAFCCLRPSDEGGETPLADMRAVTRLLDGTVMDTFERRGVRYIRHYHPNIDLPWQDVFQTSDVMELEAFCAANGIACEWLGSLLRTTRNGQGVACHPVTGERFFFNQSHLFHVSSLGGDAASAMLEIFGEEHLPRHACHADGGTFAPGMLDAVRDAFHREEIRFTWHAGDVLLLDNMQFAHGRRPFRGERNVFTVMMTPHSGTVPGAEDR